MRLSLPGGALTRKSIADVTRRRLRTLLVVLGIAFGVLGLTAINITSNSLNESIAFSANRASAPDFSFNVQAVDASLASTLAAVPNVKTVQFYTEYITRWHTSTTPVSIDIVAYADFHDVKINTFELTSGRLPGPGEVVMESSDRQLQNFAIGDRMTVETAHGLQQLRVVGMVRTPGRPGAGFLSFATAYMSTDGLSRITGITSANHIDVQLRDTRQVNATARELASLLRTHHIVIFSAFTPGSNIVQTASNAVFAIMRVLAIIALILTSFLIINTVTTLIAEQIKIIGTMKALGGTRQKVMRSYLLSVGIYGVVGTILGIGLGIFAGYEFLLYLANLFTLDLGAFQVPLSTLLTSIAVGISVPVLAALLPLWLGTKITVREAITSYGVSNGKHAPSRAPKQRMMWIPQTTRLGMRSMFRKRGRAVLTLVALMISGIAFLSVSATADSFTTGLNQFVDTYHMDALVGTQPLPYDQLRAQMLSVPNVASVERFDDQFVKTPHGQVDLEGVETDTHLYHYRLLAGRWFQGNEPGVLIISDTAAAKLHVKVGDKLTFSNATDSATWTIIGEVIDHNNSLSGGTAVTTIDNLYAFAKLPANLAAGFMVQARDPSPQAIERMANALDATLTRSGARPNIQTVQQIMASNQDQFQIVTAILYAVSAIIGLVGLLGLFNTLTISVLERRREIGILRSMGASGWRVARVFWTEGISLGVVAWIAALVAGIPAAYAFVNFIGSVLLPLPFTFAPITLAIMLAFILLIATLASFAPALSATRVRVSDILRYD